MRKHQNLSSLTAYIYQDKLRAEANAEKRNYWYAYLPEIFDEIGLRAVQISAQPGLDPDFLGQFKYLFIGSNMLDSAALAVIEEWVRQGGTLIGIASAAASAEHPAAHLFGIHLSGRLSQADNEFTISGYGRFPKGQGETRDELYDYRGALLPIFSPLELLDPADIDAEVIVELLNAGRMPTGHPCVVKRKLGAGETWYFAFDLAQTLWVMHQGRPIDRDYDGDGYYRTGDAIPFSRLHNLELPYGDYWLQMLEEIMAATPQPFIHQLPPMEAEGGVPDMLVHIGGDDECTPGIQVKASDEMKAWNLPYHMNLMPVNGEFAITMEEFQQIKENGHDLSVHFDFVKPHFHYKESDLAEQVQMYRDAFGELPIASVNHWCTGTGWAEHARWASAHGLLGDNSRAHAFNPPYNPINMIGFGFGTVYPHFVYDDYEHGNARIPFVNIPIGFFEPRIYEETREQDIARIHQSIDRACYFGWTLNVFIHPVYIADENENKDCLPAIHEFLHYVKERGLNVKYHSTNDICLWWIDRSKTEISTLAVESANNQTTVTFRTRTEHPDGCIVKVPLPEQFASELNERDSRVEPKGGHKDVLKEGPAYTVDGKTGNAVIKRQNGRLWAYCALPVGEHEVVLTL